ncbi:MAG: DUF502 domain-containing protein [Bacteriovoracaceae bacterium]
MKYLNQLFFKGLIVVLPISLTFYILFLISVRLESFFGDLLSQVVGKELYVPGLGIVATVGVVLLVGFLVNNYFTGRIFHWFNSLMERVPLIKVIYNPLKDLMALIPGGGNAKENQRVVLVPLPGLGVKTLGLVTREELDEIKSKEMISVYVPLSYMLGGITLIVPRDSVEKVDMPVDQALKLAVTAWIKAPPKN